MTMTATARPMHGTLRHQIDVNGRHTTITDEPEKLGGEDTAPTPHELLPAILASCVSTMITLYARKREWELDHLRVDVRYEPDTTPRRIQTIVHLPDGLTAEQVTRLEHVAHTCPVKRALETGFTFDEQTVLEQPTSHVTAS